MAPSEGTEAPKRKRAELSSHSSADAVLDFIRFEVLGQQHGAIVDKARSYLSSWLAAGRLPCVPGTCMRCSSASACLPN